MQRKFKGMPKRVIDGFMDLVQFLIGTVCFTFILFNMVVPIMNYLPAGRDDPFWREFSIVAVPFLLLFSITSVFSLYVSRTLRTIIEKIIKHFINHFNS